MAGAFEVQLKLLYRYGWKIRNSLSNNYMYIGLATGWSIPNSASNYCIGNNRRAAGGWSTIITINCVLCKTFYCKKRWTTWKILSTDVNYSQPDTRQQRQFLNNTYILTLMSDVQFNCTCHNASLVFHVCPYVHTMNNQCWIHWHQNSFWNQYNNMIETQY